MNYSSHRLASRPTHQAYERPERRTFGQAFRLWLNDADKVAVILVIRRLLLVLAGYAPIAALNDVLIPFTFGLAALDDIGIPIGILAAVKIFFDIRKYQDPSYTPRRYRR